MTASISSQFMAYLNTDFAHTALQESGIENDACN